MNNREHNSPVVAGIHHITAIAGDAQKNYDFYTKILGIRFVKKTINFDDPNTYHFYYGNESGQPGTILTFFPWSDLSPKARKGAGQVTTISFLIPGNSLSYWLDRLGKFNVPYSGPFKRFDDDVILFEDPDGIELELITGDGTSLPGWINGDVPEEHAIRGFHSATFSLNNTGATEEVLVDLLGYTKLKQEQNRTRYAAPETGAGMYIDMLQLPDSLYGTMGVGAIHHIAFRTENEESQLKIRSLLIKQGLAATPVVDRTYFKSIYFREPNNILFEVATDVPGFLIDEEISVLGKELRLPPWLEKDRKSIENSLPLLKVD
jgi:glyoxalase family protein